MQKLITYIEAADPTPSNNVAAGFAVGHFWRNTTSGDLFYQRTDGVWVNISKEEVAIADLDTISMANNKEYRAASAVNTLTFNSPSSGNYECWIKFTTASSGAVTVTLPNGIVGAPTIGNSETWEISVKDGVAIALKIS